jgi:hypothetical protein
MASVIHYSRVIWKDFIAVIYPHCCVECMTVFGKIRVILVYPMFSEFTRTHYIIKTKDALDFSDLYQR